jgi:hypothetical protein
MNGHCKVGRVARLFSAVQRPHPCAWSGPGQVFPHRPGPLVCAGADGAWRKRCPPTVAAPALKLLKALPRVDGTDLVFPSTKNTPAFQHDADEGDARHGQEAVPHGFRTTFRDWANERTNYPREAAEMALAHTVGDKVYAAYAAANCSTSANE